MPEPRTSRRPPLVVGALSAALVVATLIAAMMMRAPVTGVPPVLTQLARTLALSPTASGLATTLPLLCFGAFAFITPMLAARAGVEPTLLIALVVIAAGVGVRLVVSIPTFFTGTVLIGMGVALANVVVPAVVRTWFSHRLALMMGLYSLVLQISGAAGPLATSFATDAGWDWSQAIGVWLIPGIVTAAIWAGLVLRLRGRGRTPRTPLVDWARSPADARRGW